MRYAPFPQRLPLRPKLPVPKLTSIDVARALTEISQNQAAIMDEIAQIKSAIIWLNGQLSSTIIDVATQEYASGVPGTLLYVSVQLPKALSG